MPEINVVDIANASEAKTFEGFVSNFQSNIANLQKQNTYASIASDKEYELDDDGYIIGDVWSESIASDLMQLNGFVTTIERINALLEARALYESGSIPSDYKLTAVALAMDPPAFLKLFPKFPIVYLTRWGGLRKPRNLAELLDNPIKTRR